MIKENYKADEWEFIRRLGRRTDKRLCIRQDISSKRFGFQMKG